MKNASTIAAPLAIMVVLAATSQPAPMRTAVVAPDPFALTGAPAPLPAEIDTAPAHDATRVTVYADKDRSHRLVEWALDRYDQAGLAVPATDVYFHPNRQGCEGYDGIHTITAGKHRIDVCVLDQRSRERTILHEFAHAWAHTNLTDDTRQTFLAKRGLETWHDSDTEWEDRGTEHAAEIIRWGLSHQCRAPGRIGNHDPATLTTTFEFLTGTQPLCETDTDNSGTRNLYTNRRAGGPQA
jgi:hypothetical protein